MDARISPIGEGIWHVDGGNLRQPGGARIPVRSTVMRMRDRSLLIYSPIAFDDALAAALDALGEVAHVVAPSKLHHLYCASARARWPRATVHGAPGLAEKRGLAIDRTLGGGGAIDPSLDVEVIGGAPALNEAVVFHRASGTLVCADFLFHVTRPANLRTRMIFAMMGAGGGRLAQSRAWRVFRKDKRAARASIDRILAWPIAQVAPCHGEPVAIDARALAPRVTRAYGGVPPRAQLTSGPTS
jgi:hypothetical protein